MGLVDGVEVNNEVKEGAPTVVDGIAAPTTPRADDGNFREKKKCVTEYKICAVRLKNVIATAYLCTTAVVTAEFGLDNASERSGKDVSPAAV